MTQAKCTCDTHHGQAMMARLSAWITALLAIANTAEAAAQHSEARAYYLDVTGSMEPIWDEVTGNLKRAIRNVGDETTTMEVVAWTDSSHPLERCKEKATAEGKKSLCDFIDNLKLENDCHTEIYVPFDDFYRNYGGRKGETYFYLMTDGANYSKTRGKLRDAIGGWGSHTGPESYGFYVMLTDEAAAKDVESEVERQDSQLWTVATADVNIRQVKLRHTTIYSVRDGDHVDIAMEGEPGGAKITLRSDDEHFSIVRQEIISTPDGGRAIRVYASRLREDTPEDHTWHITADAHGLPRFTFLLSKAIEVRCINKPYPTVKIAFKD